jgi:hypothetical protein
MGAGPEGAAFDAHGRLWALGAESRSTVSIVDIASMKAQTLALPGSPSNIARGPGSGTMLVTLSRLGQLVELNSHGQFIRRLPGLGPSPLGVAVASERVAIVVAEGTHRIPSAIYFVDLRRWRVHSKLSIGYQCPDAREVVVVRDRAVVTCVGLPGVGFLDWQRRRVLGATQILDGLPQSLRQFVPYVTQPRGLSIITVGPNS